MIPGTKEGSITAVTGRREVRWEAALGVLPGGWTLQEATGEGPCLDAIYHQVTARVTDMATESRWPAFTVRGRGHGGGVDAVDPAVGRRDHP